MFALVEDMLRGNIGVLSGNKNGRDGQVYQRIGNNQIYAGGNLLKN